MGSPDRDASLILIQNMMHLVKTLKLPVAYRVNEVKLPAESRDSRSFVIIVHVLADHAFKRYLSNCSRSDLMLYRGLLLKVGHLPSTFFLHRSYIYRLMHVHMGVIDAPHAHAPHACPHGSR